MSLLYQFCVLLSAASYAILASSFCAVSLVMISVVSFGTFLAAASSACLFASNRANSASTCTRRTRASSALFFEKSPEIRSATPCTTADGAFAIPCITLDVPEATVSNCGDLGITFIFPSASVVVV